MKRLILYVSFSCLFSAPMWAQSLSWTEALDRMQNHNQKLKGIEKQTEAATEGKKAYQGLYLPQLSLNASYMHLADLPVSRPRPSHAPVPLYRYSFLKHFVGHRGWYSTRRSRVGAN